MKADQYSLRPKGRGNAVTAVARDAGRYQSKGADAKQPSVVFCFVCLCRNLGGRLDPRRSRLRSVAASQLNTPAEQPSAARAAESVAGVGPLAIVGRYCHWTVGRVASARSNVECSAVALRGVPLAFGLREEVKNLATPAATHVPAPN